MIKMSRTITSKSGNLLGTGIGRANSRTKTSRNATSAGSVVFSLREKVGQGLLWLSFAWGLAVGGLGIALFLEHFQAMATGSIAGSAGTGPTTLIAIVAGLPFFIAGLILNRGTVDNATKWGFLGLAIAVAAIPFGVVGAIVTGLIIL
jgi:hypothetical protein